MIGVLSRTGRLAIAADFLRPSAARPMEERAEAADLGGDCCAVISRSALPTLEATTARKGQQRKVTVQIYGKVNQANDVLGLMAPEQNVYSVNNQCSSTRFGIRGKAKIGGDWSAGYQIEAESRCALSGNLNQFDATTTPTRNRSEFASRTQNIKHEKYGELRWGLNSTPKDNIVRIPTSRNLRIPISATSI